MLKVQLVKRPAVAALLSILAWSGAQAEARTGRHSTGKNLYAIVLERELPRFAPRPIVIGRFKSLAPKYKSVPDLRTKYFVLSDRNTYGGVYLLNDRKSADAYLASPLLAEISAKAKGKRTLTRFEIPVAIDGPAAATFDLNKATGVVRIVRIKLPPQTPRDSILAGINEAVPTYQKVPGLVHKWFSIAEDGRIGGIYFFADKASADAWFNPAWHASVKARYGVNGEITTFDVPVVIEN
jgi:hypothetical protein